MSREVTVERHLSEKELEALIKREKEKRLLERLIFIRTLYDGEGAERAAQRLGRCKMTGYLWLKRWNAGGLEGLRPTFRGGRPSKLSAEERERLEETLRERDDWTTREVRSLIHERFGVRYSLRNVRRILRGLGMMYCKPYPRDYRRPEDAEERLRGAVEEALEDGGGGDGKGEVLLGFLDECRPQTSSNTQRVWSFGKPRISKNTTKYQANTFGFYAPGGESLVGFKENSKKESVCEFLEEVRERNPEGVILLVMDNFRSHKAEVTRRKAEELGIRLTYLPPYSPDLNPIEQVWRCLKREISTAWFGTRMEFLGLMEEAYNRLSDSFSFAEGWFQKFLPEEYKQICPIL